MQYLIEKEAGIPAYLQLYTQIRDAIVAGDFPYGSKLHSKRLIAEDCGISTITVEHAYALLCDEGYAEARQRSGYFVIFRPADGFVAAAEQSKNALVIPPYPASASVDFPFSVLAKTMRSVITQYDSAILERSENQGCPALRRAIAQYLARSRGIHVSAQQIIVGSGSEYLYGLIVSLLGRDKSFAIETPSYERIEEVYRSSGITPHKLPLGSDGIDTGALRECTAQVLHISPYRSYPTGVSANATKRHEYLSWAEAPGKIIIEDDFESEFSISSKPQDTLFSQSKSDNIIYMNTFSKTISPSLRVGYMVLPRHLLNDFKQKVGFYSCTVPTYIQYVLAELICNGDFERHINRVRRAKRKELQGK